MSMPRLCSRLSLLLLTPLLVVGGCASLPDRLALEEVEARNCLAAFRASDALIAEQARFDQGAHRVPAFPWLRSSRFLASFSNELGDDREKWGQWLTLLAEEDRQARRHEMANATALPHDSGQLDALMGDLAACGETLNEVVMARRDLQSELRQAVQVPDDYRTAWRWLGVYPVTRWFVLIGVNRLHADQEAALSSEHEPAEAAEWSSYLAKDGRRSTANAAVNAPFSTDILRIPRPSAAEVEALFARHAPIWRIEEASESDRIGRVRLASDRHAQVDTEEPVEYRFLSYTRFGDEILLQLNYMVWLPERPREGVFDLLGGYMDGAIWRVNLDLEGRVVAAESLHNCGCYYMVFPGEGAVATRQARGGEPIFVGPALPNLRDGERIRLSREAGSHYLIGVDRASPQADVIMPIREAGELRSLSSEGRSESLYARHGLVPETERRERWLLWTMGVPSPGAMRQPGRHAIAFAGRRHFDAPRLLEESLRPRSRED
ncbi:hypothetical protein [Natronospira bacteriovora]|uniref:Uncharacterized protein n=1 Tax=Natronospira bacteriovora TaxID=3069753 RepID=A0ABU0W9Q6_9GAMM|nr:hypothetical protein [Natronospira sp. AB-CW4]MDQ2070731.1 hypothetical protein [Natronospira sp. AB-CW4]